jgi:hypothetical protein
MLKLGAKTSLYGKSEKTGPETNYQPSTFQVVGLTLIMTFKINFIYNFKREYSKALALTAGPQEIRS